MIKEMELKLTTAAPSKPDAPSSVLKNEVLMNNTQYKKILELMLDLEKKMDKRFLEAHHETANAIVNALDVSQFKKDVDEQIHTITVDMDSKFDQVFSQRMNIAEEELDKQLASIKDLIDASAEM